jgi:8-oxo-dGTP pyrophosphatase MutT (NUDIX family)
MKSPLKQVAALPFVEVESGPLILLITTRGRGHWTIPKGWPKARLPDVELAALEAFEEAGVEGDIGDQPIGCYAYTKRLHIFSWVRCSVDVYPMQVRLQELDWPQKSSRRAKWVGPDEAVSMVREPQLADVLRDFARDRLV